MMRASYMSSTRLTSGALTMFCWSRIIQPRDLLKPDSPRLNISSYLSAGFFLMFLQSRFAWLALSHAKHLWA